MYYVGHLFYTLNDGTLSRSKKNLVFYAKHNFGTKSLVCRFVVAVIVRTCWKDDPKKIFYCDRPVLKDREKQIYM